MSSRWLQPPFAKEIGATVLRTINPQLTLWESILPQCCLSLPGDLAEIDALLDDERFFEPFRPFFDPVIRRPSIPIEECFVHNEIRGLRVPARPSSSGRSS